MQQFPLIISLRKETVEHRVYIMQVKILYVVSN